MVTVGLVLALGSEMFEPAVGIAAALIWALNPLALLYGGWARALRMFVALSMGQLFILWKLRGRPRWLLSWRGPARSGDALPHLASGLVLAAEAALLAGAAWRVTSRGPALTALAISLALFCLSSRPRQARCTVIAGHWWTGSGSLIRPLAPQGHRVFGAGALIAVPYLGRVWKPTSANRCAGAPEFGLVPVPR